jgi:hypothetical protein
MKSKIGSGGKVVMTSGRRKEVDPHTSIGVFILLLW